jgi:hypothetical protein
MNPLSVIIGALLLIGTIAAIAWPFLWDKTGPDQKRRRASLQAEYNRILIALRDIEHDHAAGKLSEADYESQREERMAQGVEILKQIDALPPEESA